MARPSLLGLAAVLLLGAAGCPGAKPYTGFNPIGPMPAGQKQRDPASVQFFEARPERPFRELGELSSHPNGSDATRDALLADMQRTAGRAGCDAIILQPSTYGESIDGVCIIWTQ
ncbi:MAG: hypothetical protein IT370_25815 [Deltaproteobacteria bacterium]|nr:hypothetical protein [Deltaproteobacteria bacterium]